MSDVLKVEGLSVGLDDGKRVLESVSFSAASGRTTALTGESECGKSIAALSIMGLLPDGVRLTGDSVVLWPEICMSHSGFVKQPDRR